MENRNIRFSLSKLEDFVRRLRRVVRFLGILGALIIALTLVNILDLAVGWVPLRLEQGSPLTLIGISVLSFVAVFILAIYFERTRKGGEALFQTISDELHGFLSSKREPQEPRLYDLLPDAEYTLKLFTQKSDIPLFPGRGGPALVVILNLLLLISTVLFQRYLSSLPSF